MSEVERARTEQKLRYAKLHLDELAVARSGSGDDFERAHLEAVLAQLLGAYADDAFLGELNVGLGCGRGAEDVTLGKLRDSLRAQGRSSAVLRRLYEMQRDEHSWFRHLQDLRHASVHVKGVLLAFRLGGPWHRKVSFKHPGTVEELPKPSVETLATWLERMRQLIDEFRELATSESALLTSGAPPGVGELP